MDLKADLAFAESEIRGMSNMQHRSSFFRFLLQAFADSGLPGLRFDHGTVAIRLSQ
jgi:hypothetical protein